MMHTVFNKSRKQEPTKKQLYGYLPSVSQTIQVRPTRHPRGLLATKKDALFTDPRFWTPAHACANVSRPTKTYFTVALYGHKMQLKRPDHKERERERESGKSVLSVQLDANDEKRLSHSNLGIINFWIVNMTGLCFIWKQITASQ